MRSLSLVVLMVFALAMTASAQTKISGKAHCPKGDMNSADVGDKPGHMLILQKITCTYTTPLEIAGGKNKDALEVFTTEMSGGAGHDNGYETATLDSGDKYVVHFWGTSKMNKDNSGTNEGKWTFVSGTGKLKGIKGGGTYKGTQAADGTSEFEVEGDYTIAAPAPKPAKTPTKK
jgi:hypothetical protein